MINQMIRSALTGNTADLTTVAGMFFLATLVIYFFVYLKPAIDSKRRINRQVQRRIENYRANQIFNQRFSNKILKGSSESKSSKSYNQRSSNKILKGALETKSSILYDKSKSNNYSKDKGYQAYLKHNSNDKQVVKFFYKSANGASPKRLNDTHQSFDKKSDNFRPMNTLSQSEQVAWGDKIRKANGL